MTMEELDAMADKAIESCVRAAIQAAVLEERERCAKIVLGDSEREDFPYCGDVRELANAIRGTDLAAGSPEG